MPQHGMMWRHVIINTKCTWLHGDERGFRSRWHRIHSSGDYRNPPPLGEHLDLHRYHEKRSGDEVHIPYKLRPVIGQEILAYLRGEHYRLLALAVTKIHSHFLVELANDLRTVKRIVGEAKRKSSRAVKNEIPGSVWSAGGTYKLIETRGHLDRANSYVLYDQGAGAWTWSVNDAGDDGQYGRKRTPE
jgi:hypothetical protein